MTINESKGSVWDDLIDDPAEREVLRMKSCLSIEISEYIKRHKLRQQGASDRMRVQR